MKTITRRDALSGIALGGAALATGCAATTPRPTTAEPAAAAAVLEPSPTSGEAIMSTPPAFASKHQPVALPFKASALNGISEKMISSHHENNYGGAVKNLNRVEQELAATNKDTPPFVVAALRDRELTFRNSKTLHEAYFANLGGDGKRSGNIEAPCHRRMDRVRFGSSTFARQDLGSVVAAVGSCCRWSSIRVSCARSARAITRRSWRLRYLSS
jgi:hypothetical protein